MLFRFVCLMILSTTSFAVTPVSKEVKKVVDYYYNGKAKGPLLVDFVPCLKVNLDPKSSSQYSCKTRAKGSLKKGTKISAWTNWLVPEKGNYDDIMIQFVHDGIVRSTQDITLNAGIRKRAFRTIALNKTGKWQIKVLRNRKVIASAKLKVVK